MDIQYISVNDIVPYANNPRDNQGAVKYVKQSIKEFGFKVPIILDSNFNIISGHTRFKASIELGITEVPCIIADDLTPEQVKAFRIADNKVSEYAEWDMDALKKELESLELIGYDLIENNIDFKDFDFDMEDEFLPDELELERTEQGNVPLNYLRFGSYKIALSEEEMDKLTYAIEDYLVRKSVTLGFVTELFEKIEANTNEEGV